MNTLNEFLQNFLSIGSIIFSVGKIHDRLKGTRYY